jgi:DNA-binding phage protein
MDILSSLGFKKKPVPQTDRSTTLREIANQELKDYIKREDLQKYLNQIQHDKERKLIWDGMSNILRLKLLRYLARKRGIKNEK